MSKTYFLGSSSPTGFETGFGEDIKSPDNFTYIIKGGPGTGKSTLMKRVAEALEDVSEVEYYRCSSDPDSLDGVIFRDLGVILVDGTAPHVFEPLYPGARQQLVDLGRFWDAEKLRKNADGIVSASDENAALHARVRRYLGAIYDLGSDIFAAGEDALDRKKLAGYCARLAKKLFPSAKKPIGKISLKQITSMTPKGVLTQESAFSGCKIFAVDDPFFAVSDAMLKMLSVSASEAGYDVVASRNSRLAGCRYEHIVIPELSLAFASGWSGESVKHVNAMRFYDADCVRLRRKKLGFPISLRKELTSAAVGALAEAKTVHDRLESYYIDGMDFDAVGRETARLIEEIRGRK